MPLEYISHRSKSERQSSEQHNFGVIDRKRREFGAIIYRSLQTYEPGPENNKSPTGYEWQSGSTSTQPGLYFAWIGQATRGGLPFGACQDLRLCKSEEEREAAIAKYLAAAKKRAIATSAKELGRGS